MLPSTEWIASGEVSVIQTINSDWIYIIPKIQKYHSNEKGAIAFALLYFNVAANVAELCSQQQQHENVEEPKPLKRKVHVLPCIEINKNKIKFLLVVRQYNFTVYSLHNGEIFLWYAKIIVDKYCNFEVSCTAVLSCTK